jgi:hypothetical protein
MKKQIVIISIAILLSTVLISGCNEETNTKAEKTFIGSWRVTMGSNGEIETWVFREDNTGTHNFGNFSENFTWSFTPAVLCFSPPDNPIEQRCGEYTFSSDNRKFTWSDPRGFEIEYKRLN